MQTHKLTPTQLRLRALTGRYGSLKHVATYAEVGYSLLCKIYSGEITRVTPATLAGIARAERASSEISDPMLCDLLALEDVVARNALGTVTAWDIAGITKLEVSVILELESSALLKLRERAASLNWNLEDILLK